MGADNDMYSLTPLPFQGADCSHSALSSCNSFSDDFQSFLEDQFHDDEVASAEPATSLALASIKSGRPPRPDAPAGARPGAVARTSRRKLRNRASQRQWRTRQKVRSIYNLRVSLAQLCAIVQAGLTELYTARASQYPVTVMPCRPRQTIWKLKLKLEQRSSRLCKHANSSLKHRMPCWRMPFPRRLTLTRNTYTHWWGSILITQHPSTYCGTYACFAENTFHVLEKWPLACLPACVQQLERSKSNATATALTLSPSCLVSCCIHQ